MIEVAERPKWFDDEVLAAMPSLKAFAISLCRHHAKAEDLVHDTVFRAFLKFEQYEAGTNLKGWLLTIMRNHWYSAMRKRGREVADPDGVFAALVPVNEGQTWAYDLKVVRKRMRLLNSIQRRSVELVAIHQHSYEYAAEQLGIAVGTVKSQVSRARDFLETGIEPEAEQVDEIDVSDPDVESSVERLFRAGKSISEIKSEIDHVSRSDIMRIIVERKLKAPAR